MLETDFQPFENRLRKMARHYGRWARRQDIHCYRIYDADIPEFPFAIDRYEQFVHVSEYERPHERSEIEQRGWRLQCRRIIETVLEVPKEQLFLKDRQPQSGDAQYEKRMAKGREHPVREGGLQFLVNLTDYLDTGLFLDHRQTRERVRQQISGKRFLNLFAYTGSFTVYAAAGKATYSLTIDLSNTYLNWAERNLALNQLTDDRHEYLRADVLDWLKKPTERNFDVIVLDPPTFSNSKAMYSVLDVQRDHAFLVNRCLRLLRPGGLLIFSTNFRRFRLAAATIESDSIREITAQTVPPDFRNKKIHACWEIKRADR